MCGRFSQHYSWSEVRDYYDLIPGSPASNMEARYNIGPQSVGAMIRAHDDGLQLEPALFWLVPLYWRKKASEMKFSTFNARSEKVTESKVYAPVWKKGHRGIVPVSGFYEWPRPKVKGDPPYFITHPEKPFLSLACIWTSWTDPEGEKPGLSFSLLTTEPNGVMDSIPHHRCPVVIDDAHRDLWLHGEPDDAAALLKTPPDDVMTTRRVSAYVNSVRNQGAECLAPAETG